MNLARPNSDPKLRIVSYSSKPFRSREEAGQLLGQELIGLRVEKPVVLGIPRGGVVVAIEIARVLGADLDVVLSRKLRAPGQQELAIGAVAEGDKLFLNDFLVQELGVSEDYIQQEKEIQLEEINRRSAIIRQALPSVPLKGRLVIITDDGVATGATIEAAIWTVKQDRAARLLVAVPVGSENTVARLAVAVDQLVCLRVPVFFAAVGQFYLHFEQVEDEDLLNILREFNKNIKGKQYSPDPNT